MEEDSRVDLWMEHYPKATWIIAAIFYHFTGNIESGKCLSLIWHCMLLILLGNILRKILDKKWVGLILLLVTINPIFLVQWLTYYVDGLMGILFTTEVLLLMTIQPNKKSKWIPWMCFASTATLMVNIKFTGLVCSGVVAAVYYFAWLIQNRCDFLTVGKRITITFSIAYIIAIFLVGANSYVKNTIDHHQPLYPLMGKDKVDIITTMQPKSFQNKSKIEKFFISYFSKSQNALYDQEPTLKFPLSMDRSEIIIKQDPDTRIAGFGPFFAAAMILCCIFLGIASFKLWKKDKEKGIVFSLPFIAIIASMLLVGESWWARYVPQFYLVPVITIILLLYEKKHFKCEKTPIILSLVLAGFLCINSIIFLHGNLRSFQTFSKISNDIKEMKKMNALEIKLENEELHGYYYTLKDNRVTFKINQNLKETEIIYKYDKRVMVKEQ